MIERLCLNCHKVIKPLAKVKRKDHCQCYLQSPVNIVKKPSLSIGRTSVRPIRRNRSIKQIGKGTIKYNQWRDSVAKPYLFTQGNFCAICGKASKHLDVDHIKKRGSHPQLKMNIDNVRLVCRSCHIKIT